MVRLAVHTIVHKMGRKSRITIKSSNQIKIIDYSQKEQEDSENPHVRYILN